MRHPITAPNANEPTKIPTNEPMDLKKAPAVNCSPSYSSTVLKIEQEMLANKLIVQTGETSRQVWNPNTQAASQDSYKMV